PTCAHPWHPDHFTHLFRRLADTVGIEEPLKNLRHFNATQLLAAGVDLRTTAGRLGHGDGGATTLRVYASWTRPADRIAVDNLSRDLVALREGIAGQLAIGQANLGLGRIAKPIDQVLTRTAVSTYVDIAAAIRAALSSGGLSAGDLLPTVSQIAGFFGVARSTAQRAVSEVAREGLIVRRGVRWIRSD
ncbi:MAG: GntR family transcriptional regulator, partial [Actinobacteria bacterium]|nr:GntR family transcriptional regulator [Actinomycetota bacterium]